MERIAQVNLYGQNSGGPIQEVSVFRETVI